METTLYTKLPNYSVLKEHEDMSSTTKWRWVNPETQQLVEKSWTTVFRDQNHPSETVSQFRQRHQDEVDAQWTTYPPSFQ